MFTEHKILPFTGALGPVPGHAVLTHKVNGKRPTHVVFWNFDAVAQCETETLVHVCNWTKYMHGKWPGYGSIVAVILENGQRVHATSRSASHYDDKAWHAAPALTRTAHQIEGLCSHQLLVEIVGVRDWCYSRKDASILDPWARDNAAYEARATAAA